MKRARTLLALLGLAMISGVGAVALAHDTGHESRTVAQCELLPTPERQACIKCVTLPKKHHFHPDYPAGNRCRPDDGKP